MGKKSRRQKTATRRSEQNVDKKVQKQSAKERRVNPALLAAMLILLTGLIFAVFNKPSDSQSAASVQMTPKVPTPSQALSNLGKTLVVGSEVGALLGDGVVHDDASQSEQFTRLLDGRETGPFVDAVKKAGYRAVLVDPGLAVRNPPPQATVRNRLALANPVRGLTATYMTSRFFLYQFRPTAPDLTVEDKENLLAIVNQAIFGRAAKLPHPVSALLHKEGDWEMFATLRWRNGAHLTYHALFADTLANGAKALGQKIAKYYQDRTVDEAGSALTDVLGRQVGVELEVVYDKGVFTGPRERRFMWRIFEPGIYGMEALVGERMFRMPPWYSVTNNLRTLQSIFGRLLRKFPAHTWLSDRVPLWRFRTVHFRENLNSGKVVDLYRANPYVPSPKEVTRERLIESLGAFGDWFDVNRARYADDRMIYRYFPTIDKENNEYNMVRHALGAYSAAMVQEFSPKPSRKETADACLRWLEKRLRWGGPPVRTDGTPDGTLTSWQGKPLPGKDVAIIDADENMYDDGLPPAVSNKMGMVAVAILGYTQYKKVGWSLSPARERILRGLANFVLYMQKSDGSFHHYYVAPQNGYYGQRNSIYPGEILYAVARLYGETGDERFRTAFKQSMQTNLAWFKREMEQREPDGTYAEKRRKELVQFQPWIAMAMEEMYRYDPDPAYVAASNLVSLWILDSYQYDDGNSFYPDYVGGYLKVLDELPAMHSFVYTEGTAASYVLARTAGADPQVIDQLRKGALLTARFILQQQVKKGLNDYIYPNPERAHGGVKYCLNHNKQRIDYSYHALSSVYRILHAATPADYAFVNSMALPDPN